MGKNAKHSTLPWIYENETGFIYSQEAVGANRIADMASPMLIELPGETVDANGAFIVKAVNAHDDLVAAIRNVLQYRQGTFPNGYLRDNDTTRAALQQLADALAKAEASR